MNLRDWVTDGSIIAPSHNAVARAGRPRHVRNDERSGNGIAKRRGGRHSGGVNTDSTATILAVLERAPQWVRHDLGSKDPAIRARAEETLAAMIASALAGEGDA